MYYVIISDFYGAARRVEHFDTRAEAIKFIESLDDTQYMVTLRNDANRLAPLSI